MQSSVITKVQTTYTSDGQGGYTEETIELGSFDVKLSIGNNVEEANAYGVSVEEMLKVIADVPLLEEDSEAYIIIGPAGKDGDGFAPTIVEKTNTDDEYVLTITDVNGSYDTPNLKGAQGVDGAQGEQGEKGDDGFSPTIVVKTSTSDEYILTITDATQSYDTPNLKGGGSGGSGVDGTTFTPSVSEDGIISWTNDGGKANPDPVNIKGPQGEQGIQGETGAAGADGVTPSITATASVDNTSSDTPTVTVTKSGDDATPAFDFAFVGLKGTQGEQGEKGEDGTNGTDGVTPDISITATADATSSDAPTVTVTKNGTTEAPSFTLAFSGLKGAQGAQGAKGDTGDKGDKGDTGDSYTITSSDYSAIAEVVYNSYMTNAANVSY